MKVENKMYLPYKGSFVKDAKLFQIWLLLVPIVSLNRILCNPTFFMTSFIVKISLFNSFKFMETSVRKIGKKVNDKKIREYEEQCQCHLARRISA